MKANYSSIYPSHFKLDGGAMFGIIPKPLWEKKLPSDKLNRIEMNCRIFYINVDDRHILIDLGAGDYHDEKFNKRFGLIDTQHPVSDSLQELTQVSPNEITDIVLTHLHFDHIGGLGTKDGTTPYFPNATVHIHKKHFEYSLKPTPKDSGSFQQKYYLPLVNHYDAKGKVNWLQDETEGAILKTSSGYQLNYKTSFGHTPYQVLPFDENIIYLGDLVPTSHHVHLPWVMGYDLHPGESSLEKIKIYDFMIEQDLIGVFDHDKDFWGGKIKKLDQWKYEFETLYPSESNSFEKHSLS